MFRLFIHRKLKAARGAKTPKKSAQEKKRRNRRVLERYPIDHKHLTLMNEQDILLIREISTKGFSSYVSERASQRFVVGDVYSARMRYLGDLYDLNIKVSWKAKSEVIGFEIVKADKRTTEFLNRIIYPIAIAGSLREVNAKFMAANDQGKIWYHGDEDTDLYVWHDTEGNLSGWQFIHKNHFIEWTPTSTVLTGKIDHTKESINAVLSVSLNEANRLVDKQVNDTTKQLAVDVFMAMQLPYTPQMVRVLVS